MLQDCHLAGTWSSPCQGKAKAGAPPSPWPLWCAGCQWCGDSAAAQPGTGRVGAHVSFGKFSRSPPQCGAGGITCPCGGRQAQRGRVNLSPIASQLPQNVAWGRPPFPERGQPLCWDTRVPRVPLERQQWHLAPLPAPKHPTPGSALGSMHGAKFKLQD